MTSNFRNVFTHQKGFTLIEIIMVLVLVGVIGSVGTLGLSTFIQNYVIAKQGTNTISAGQMAMLRIAKELETIAAVNKNVTETGTDKIRFTSIHDGAARFFKIAVSGTDLNLSEYNDNVTTTATSTDLLINNVASFSLQYYDWVSSNSTLASPTSVWTDKVQAPSCTDFISSGININDCKNNPGNDKIKLSFTSTNIVDYPPPYVLFYGGKKYWFCEETGNIYHASDQGTSANLTCGGSVKKQIDGTGMSYYPDIYIYSEARPDCVYTGIGSYLFNAGSPCTAGPPNNNPNPAALADGTRLLKVTLKLEGISAPFSLDIAPRNI